ncbi:MAG: hypothetical protein NC911_03080 [Candidatus Omnitrophica bacterium]|nr:hypothetical protein [Candidatus Omnitrophota bacterium]
MKGPRVAGLLLGGLVILVGCQKLDKKATGYAQKTDIELTAEFLREKWSLVYLHLYQDLPHFYFVPLQDMTTADSTRVRIWAEEDLRLGRCDQDLKKTLKQKKLAAYWRGPYMICPMPGVFCTIGNYPIKEATKDIWGRSYRMFYYTFGSPEFPTETERKLIPPGEKGVMILISGGPDGVLQSCAADRSDRDSLIKTAPPVEKAGQKDFARFDPFSPYLSEPDPYTVLSIRKLQAMKDKADRNYEEFLRRRKEKF